MHYNAQNAQISDFSPGFRLLSNKSPNTKKTPSHPARTLQNQPSTKFLVLNFLNSIAN